MVGTNTQAAVQNDAALEAAQNDAAFNDVVRKVEAEMLRAIERESAHLAGTTEASAPEAAASEAFDDDSLSEGHASHTPPTPSLRPAARDITPRLPPGSPRTEFTAPHPRPAPRPEKGSTTPGTAPPAAPLVLSEWADAAEPQNGHPLAIKGPCFVKMLVPAFEAGAIIGKGGVTISRIESRSQCRVQVSPAGKFFPGTRERIVVMGGTMQGLERGLPLLFQQAFSLHGEREAMVKLAVPNSFLGAFIGPCGHTVRSLSQRTGCRINATHRVPRLLERLLVISGLRDALLCAVLEVCRAMQVDPHLSEHITWDYDVKLPLGAWESNIDLPKEPEVPPLHAQDVQDWHKRELVQYLFRAAPRRLLLEHGIGGKEQNVLKSHGTQALLKLVEATWRAREAQGPAREPQVG